MKKQERLAALHARMETMRRKREDRITAALSAGCAVIGLMLIMMIAGSGKAHDIAKGGLYTGTTMLFENAGGYVLAAILAFMTGVVITVICLRRRHLKDDAAPNGKTPEDNDEKGAGQ